MRPALVIGFLALAFLVRITFGDAPEGSFDDRFTRAERELEELSASIEEEIETSADSAGDRD